VRCVDAPGAAFALAAVVMLAEAVIGACVARSAAREEAAAPSEHRSR
jgi:hypothetical protein